MASKEDLHRKEWVLKCKTWVTSDRSLYSLTATAPPPSKNFVQVYVTDSEIIFRVWKIIPPTRADANQTPAEYRCTYDEFADDEKMRGEVERTMGPNELNFIDHLIAGEIDYLNRLPRKVLLRILFQLDLVSLSKLSKVNRLFRELCHSDVLWSKIFMEHTKQPITQELLMIVDEKGWKEVFFMNKLQLQVQMRRHSEAIRDKPSSPTFFLTDQELSQSQIEEEDIENLQISEG